MSLEPKHDEPSIFRKGERAIDDLVHLFKRRPWVCILVICIFILPAWLAAIGTLWGVPSLQRKISNLERDKSQLKDELNSNKKDSQMELTNIKRERDEAQHALASWMLLAQSSNTNTPLTARLDKLVEQGETDIAKFGLMINGASVTNEMSVTVPSDRIIRIVAENLGNISANQLTIDFVAAMPGTNWIANGWQPQSGLLILISNKWTEVTENVTHYAVISEAPVSASRVFMAPPLQLSSNVTAKTFPVRVDVYSSKSKTKNFALIFKLTD